VVGRHRAWAERDAGEPEEDVDPGAVRLGGYNGERRAEVDVQDAAGTGGLTHPAPPRARTPSPPHRRRGPCTRPRARPYAPHRPTIPPPSSASTRSTGGASPPRARCTSRRAARPSHHTSRR